MPFASLLNRREGFKFSPQSALWASADDRLCPYLWGIKLLPIAWQTLNVEERRSSNTGGDERGETANLASCTRSSFAITKTITQ